MERMPLSPMTLTRSARPDSMSSMRLLPRQCRLVGKLTMKRGGVSWPVIDEHAARLHGFGLAGSLVSLEVLG